MADRQIHIEAAVPERAPKIARIWMASLRALLTISFVFLIGRSLGAYAQSLPFAPFSPTDIRECQSFSNAVQAYAADYAAQHQQCLANNKPDREEEAGDSSTCSRSSCQYLHDIVYGDSVLSVKYFQREISSCYQRVNEYQAERARRSKEEAEEQAKEKQEEADRAERRQRDKDAEDKQRATDLATSKENQDRNRAAAIRAEAAWIATQKSQEPPVSIPNDSKQQSSQRAAGSRKHSKTPSILADPFQHSGNKTASSREIASNATIVDPFAPKESLVDPFGERGTDAKLPTGASARDKAGFEVSSRTIELSTNKAVSKLDLDVAYLRSRSGQTISRAKANGMIREIQDTRSVLKTLNGFVTGGQYLVLMKSIASADSRGKRDEAWGNLVKQASGDALRSDLVREGMTTVAPRIFGERVGLALVGVAGLSVESGAILLDSTKINRDPNEIIHDSSGKVSLSEKQNALMSMWNGYERRQSQTNNSSTDQINRDLWINSNIVYNECLETKASCDQWKSLVGPK